MNYPFAYAMLDFFINKEKGISPAELHVKLDELLSAYGQENMSYLWNLVESHDTERISSMVMNPDRRGFDRDGSLRDNVEYDLNKPGAEARQMHKLIAVFQMTFSGSPVIYYGTEAGMWGADDPDNRKPMLWADLVYDMEKEHPVKGKKRPEDVNSFDQNVFDFYKKLIELRKRNSAMRVGSYTGLKDTTSVNTFGFVREAHDQQIICLFNRGERAEDFGIHSDTFKSVRL